MAYIRYPESVIATIPQRLSTASVSANTSWNPDYEQQCIHSVLTLLLIMFVYCTCMYAHLRMYLLTITGMVCTHHLQFTNYISSTSMSNHISGVNYARVTKWVSVGRLLAIQLTQNVKKFGETTIRC